MVIVCEVSFEVCNKVGGIYTVVSSKVPFLQKKVDKLITIGPWLKHKHQDFIQYSSDQVPSYIQDIFDVLSSKGIYCTYGRWNIPGMPETILIDYFSFSTPNNLNYLKKKYWDEFSVDSLNTPWDFDEPLSFSSCAGMFIEELAKRSLDKVVGQFHEWMCGFGGLYLKAQIKNFSAIQVKTVFTTHATMLGRSLSSRNISLKSLPKDFSSDESARRIGIIHKHTTEKACALHLDYFTTVSDITANEAELFFGIRPIVTYNGINDTFFSHGKDLILKQHESRKHLEELVKWKFSLTNSFDFSLHTFIYTSGRPEFHNKGFDTIIKSLGSLQKEGKEVVCFFFVLWNHYGLKQPDLGVSTHHIDDEFHNSIISACREEGLDNKGSVKVILYPPYLGSTEDVFFKGSYYDTIMGCDLGVFPSFYEPWGYTPLESCAVGVPAITSSETGFGAFCLKHSIKGVEIVEKDFSEVDSLKKIISEYSHLSSEEKLAKILFAKHVAKICSWNSFIKKYVDLYED